MKSRVSTVPTCGWSCCARECPLYTTAARALHCRGRGSCGTCAVKIEGDVSEPTKKELLRLRFPPHDVANGLRLACQCSVLGDIKVAKFSGFFGQHSEEES